MFLSLKLEKGTTNGVKTRFWQLLFMLLFGALQYFGIFAPTLN